MVKRQNTYNEAKRIHPTVDWDNTFMYRVRGINPYTNRDVWFTTGWDRTLEEANLNLRVANNRWTNLRIIKKSVGQYMTENQNIPKFN